MKTKYWYRCRWLPKVGLVASTKSVTKLTSTKLPKVGLVASTESVNTLPENVFT